MRKRLARASRNGVTAAQSMQLVMFEKKIGFQSNERPMRVMANANVCVFMMATRVQTPKISARRRQVMKGEVGDSAIRGISVLRYHGTTRAPVRTGRHTPPAA